MGRDDTVTATEIIAECARRGIELRATEKRIEWRPDAKLQGSLREALVAHRREVASELRRDDAVAGTWERLRLEYERAGHPANWITGEVRSAEHIASELWLSARQNTSDDERFHDALRQWEQAAIVAIQFAGTQRGHV